MAERILNCYDLYVSEGEYLMNYLLFVDDDLAFLKINRTFFERLGYTVFTAVNRNEMEHFLDSQPIDCIILDIMIPGDGNGGYDLCKVIRQTRAVPVIFLTSLTEKECLYQGFDAGADDYMTKPYELRELEVRIRARISHINGNGRGNEILAYPPLTIDPGGRKLLIDGQPLTLTPHEFDILLLLARSPGTVFSMSEIYRLVWKLPDLDNTQTVRVHLARMRHKLEEACPDYRFIQLCWGKGFYFEALLKEAAP